MSSQVVIEYFVICRQLFTHPLTDYLRLDCDDEL